MNNIGKISKAMASIGDLAKVLGIKNINELPGCWEHQLDKDWWFALNGHNETAETSIGQKIEPYNCLVQFKGIPTGYFSPFEGVFFHGKEDEFIKALDLKLQEYPKGDDA